DAKSGLFNPALFNVPRCYTFLEPKGKKPARLILGHAWGATVYDLRPGNVTVARYLIGHEGEVMSLAPSADGKLLVTASRDQTLCTWSLEDWPTHRELGAGFTMTRDNKLLVRKVDAGSPAWECGLAEGDEILTLVINADRFVYDPSGANVKKYGF